MRYGYIQTWGAGWDRKQVMEKTQNCDSLAGDEIDLTCTLTTK